jgi:hypothetical protein
MVRLDARRFSLVTGNVAGLGVEVGPFTHSLLALAARHKSYAMAISLEIRDSHTPPLHHFFFPSLHLPPLPRFSLDKNTCCLSATTNMDED